MAYLNCSCKLSDLVESHDMPGLQRAIDDSMLTCVTYRWQPQLGHKKQDMLEHHRVVEKACILGHFDMVELFLLNGCSANLPTSHGRLVHTILMSLKSHRHLVEDARALKLIQLLMSLDCDVNVKTYDGRSPLFLTSELADPDIMKQILDGSSDWQLTCRTRNNGHTPLHMACMSGSVGCVRLLLERMKDIDLDKEDNYGFSPLHCSLMMLKNNMGFHHKDGSMTQDLIRVQYSHVSNIQLLLAAGACPNRTSKCLNSRSAILIALEIVQQYHHKYVSDSCLVKLSPSDNSGIHTNTEVTSSSQHNHTYTERTVTNRRQHWPVVYTQVVGMLVAASSRPSLMEELLVYEDMFPSIPELINEIKDWTDTGGLPRVRLPASLVRLSRAAILLQVARYDRLSCLDQLPLPARLKDFLTFQHF